jgi:hypothetical protein
MPSMLLATNGIDYKTTKEKNIKKSYDVTSNNTLKVNNSYGNLDILTWNENRIEFDITIKVSGNNTEKIDKKLKEINIEFSKSDGIVSAITKFNNKKKSWWNWSNTNNMKIEVNYRVKMPISNNVDLNNDYGAINLDKLEGHAKLNCDYGKITTKELMGKNNDIRFDYSNNCYFEYINSGKINADYSGFTVGKTKNLSLNADYTKSIIEVSENVNYNCDYGSLKIDNINNLDGNGDYLTLRLGNVYKNVKLKANYGSLKIARMASKAKSIDINSDYVGITIGYDANYSFDFNIELGYGSLRASEGFTFTHKEVDHSDKQYKGYHGAQNSGNVVKIKSDYGSVTFKNI